MEPQPGSKVNFPFSYKHSNLYEIDYKSLQPATWLTAEVINLSFILLKERYDVPAANLLDPSFVSYLLFETDEQELVQLKSAPHNHFKNYKYLLAPVNTNQLKQSTGDHWSLLIVDMEEGTAQVYDSCGRLTPNCQKACQALANLKRIVCEQESTQKWPVQLQKSAPKQRNGYDCGVFVVAFAQAFLKSQINKSSMQEELENIDYKKKREIIKSQIQELIKKTRNPN